MNNLLAFLPKMYFPKKVFFGPKSQLFLKTLEQAKKLLIIDQSFKEKNQELVESLFSTETQEFIQQGEPTVDDFDRLKEKCQQAGFDYLIALGGGAVIDLVKLVKKELGLRMVALPTTIGSGAEASQHALLIEGETKKIQSSPELLPEVVLVSPDFVKSLSRQQIILQAVDALSHALEALVSRMAYPLSDSFALRATAALYDNLSKLNEQEPKEQILSDLQTAALLAGLAQSSVGTGLAHSLAHYYGAKHKISHSKAIASFLIDVLKLNNQQTDKYQKLNQIKDLSADNFIEKLESLFKELKVESVGIEIGDNLEETAQLIKSWKRCFQT